MNTLFKWLLLIGLSLFGILGSAYVGHYVGYLFEDKQHLPTTVVTIPFEVKEGDYNANFNFKTEERTYKIVIKTNEHKIIGQIIYSSIHKENVKLTGYVGTRGHEFYFFVIKAEMESGKDIYH